MTVNNTGSTRLVFIFRHRVVKLPNPTYSWQNFLRGLCANISEWQTWAYNGYDDERKALRDELLCPVLWASWGGWILVMRKVDVGRHIEEVRDSESVESIEEARDENAARYARWIDAGFGGDDKCDSYGYLGDRLVKIDYGQ